MTNKEILKSVDKRVKMRYNNYSEIEVIKMLNLGLVVAIIGIVFIGVWGAMIVADLVDTIKHKRFCKQVEKEFLKKIKNI